MNSRIGTIARYTLLEAGRTRLAVLVAAAILAALAVSFFVQSITIAESGRFQAGAYAAGARLACVFIAGFYVLTCVAREQHDRVLDVLLALDLPRSHYVLGKLAGFVAIAAIIGLAAAAPLAWLAPAQAAAQWGISLGLELALVAALALFCMLAFSQVTAAACFMLAFYLLARSLSALRLIGENPIAGADSASHELMRLLIEGLALLMPALDQWTRTTWLVDEPAAWADILRLAGFCAVYVALLASATLFDFHRKNF